MLLLQGAQVPPLDRERRALMPGDMAKKIIHPLKAPWWMSDLRKVWDEAWKHTLPMTGQRQTRFSLWHFQKHSSLDKSHKKLQMKVVYIHFLYHHQEHSNMSNGTKQMLRSEVAQSCLTLCDPMDCSLSASIQEIFQARILEWVAISFSRGSSQPRDGTRVSRIAGRHFTF